MMKKFFEGLAGGISQFVNDVKKPFLPSYQVVFRMYQVIPGREVEQNEQKFDFEKGASAEANAYFQKVVTRTQELNMVPSEVILKKGRRTMTRKTFGPVDDVVNYLNVKAS